MSWGFISHKWRPSFTGKWPPVGASTLNDFQKQRGSKCPSIYQHLFHPAVRQDNPSTAEEHGNSALLSIDRKRHGYGSRCSPDPSDRSPCGPRVFQLLRDMTTDVPQWSLVGASRSRRAPRKDQDGDTGASRPCRLTIVPWGPACKTPQEPFMQEERLPFGSHLHIHHPHTRIFPGRRRGLALLTPPSNTTQGASL